MKELQRGSLLPADSIKESFSKKAARFVLKNGTRIIPVSTLIAASCFAGSGAEKNNNPKELVSNESGYSLPFPEGETWFLTNGPHGDGYSNGMKYAIDIAPPELGRLNGQCPTDGSRLSINNRSVTASASGEVIAKGDDKNRNDIHHSEIRIKDNSGLTQVYIHLDNTKVKLGDKVKQGDPLGNPSCEYPPGGKNTGPHLHVGFMKDGKAIPIDNVVIGGWTIHENGTMTKNGEKTRTADVGRHGENHIGIRNDLPNNSNKALVAGPKSPISPISGSVKEKSVSPTPKSTETPRPTESPTSKEGILAVGNWQFEVQKWTESPYKPTHDDINPRTPTKQYREGWKYVRVDGKVRNFGANILELSSHEISEKLYEIEVKGKDSDYTNNVIQFTFFSADNNKYDIDDTTSTTILPPGFSDSFTVTGWIPEIQKNYELSAVLRGGGDPSMPQSPKQGAIKKGEVAKDSPAISPEVVLNGIGKPWIIPNFGEINYNNKTVSVQGNLTEDLIVEDLIDRGTKKYRIYQYISLNLQNNSGQDISPTSLSFVIFPKNGDGIEGQEATKQGLEPSTIPPGSKKSFYVYLPIGEKIIDEEIKGGILVGINKDNWFAWQLP